MLNNNLKYLCAREMLLTVINIHHYGSRCKKFSKPLVHLLSALFSKIFTMCFNFIALNPTALLEFRHLC